MQQRVNAFSLVELSIVLVILGLLVGGVLSGQSLIRAAELRSVATDFSRYAAAMNSFRDKYFGLPGDITNATSFWGVAGGTGNNAACYNTVSTDIKTCNGNGNGHTYPDDNVADRSGPEWYRAWQHLANAGLVEGRYTGTKSASPIAATPGVNVPRGRMSGSGYTWLSYDPSLIADAQWWLGKYDGFFFGSTSATFETHEPILKPEEAWNIDTKMDDGKPATGSVRDLLQTDNGNSSCNTTTTATTALYNLSSTNIVCSLIYAITPPGNS